MHHQIVELLLLKSDNLYCSKFNMMTSGSSFIVKNLTIKVANERSIMITPTDTKQSPTVYLYLQKKKSI